MKFTVLLDNQNLLDNICACKISRGKGINYIINFLNTQKSSGIYFLCASQGQLKINKSLINLKIKKEILREKRKFMFFNKWRWVCNGRLHIIIDGGVEQIVSRTTNNK